MPSVAQPAGTVTMVFTDIEGSTRLLEELGMDAYRNALAQHRRIVRDACARHDGYEVDYAGDAFFYAFASAQAAVDAVSEAMMGLEAGPIRIRVGIHTGEPGLDPPKYVGIDVHHAARIMAAGHGGQVLLSQSTRDFVEADVRDLGEHRLKDLSEPRRLYQFGSGAFPALKTLYRTNLPVPATPFVGRERELREVSELLLRDDVRLLTLTGPGGTGKTRLALQAVAGVSDEYPDGVYWVPLAALRDPALVVEAAAHAIGAKEGFAEHVADRRVLILLDNFEHLIEASADVAAVLAACPRLDMVVTSRERLQLAAEHERPVPSLEPADAVDLFMNRARALGSESGTGGAVAELCARLDDLPLAIELAAAWTKVLTPAQLLTRLGQRLDLFKGGRDANPRQRTLRATIQWSYDLLTPKEQALFARLSVFAGGWTLEAAEAVCDAHLDTLSSLLDKSLVQRRGDRFSMLETIRDYAAEHLDRSEEARRCHAERFVAFAEQAEEGLAGPEQAGWLERSEEELDNLRAALDWCLANDRVADALRSVSALGRFWRAHGHVGEARRLLARGIAQADKVPVEVRARALWTAAHEAMAQSDYREAVPALEEALAIFRGLGDDRHAVFALCELARALSLQDELERAHRVGEDALAIAEGVGDVRAASAALDTLAMVADYRGEHRQALAFSERSLDLRRSLGDAILITSSTNTLGLTAMGAGDLDTAEQAFTECLELSRGLGQKVYEAAALCALGEIALRRDQPELAAGRLLEALESYREMGDERASAECLHALGGVAAALGRALDATRLWGAAEALRERSGAGLTPEEKEVDRRFAALVAAQANPVELEQARTEGRSLPDDAVDGITTACLARAN